MHQPPIFLSPKPLLSPFYFQKYFVHIHGDTMDSVLYLVFPLTMSHRSFVWMYNDLITAQLTKVSFLYYLVLQVGWCTWWGVFLAGALSSLETAKLYSHQQCMQMPFSPRPCQYILILLNQTGTLMRKA